MSKIFKRIVVVFFAILLVFAGTVGCAPEQFTPQSNPEVVTEPGTYPIIKEEFMGIELTMMGLNHASIDPDWGENAFFKRMENLTGLKFSFDRVCGSAEYADKFPVAFLDPSTLPDVFYKAQIPRDREVKYGSQGLLIPLEGLIEKYAPNLKKLMEETPNIRRVITSADGHIYTLPTVHYPGDSYTFDGIFWINKKWCDKLSIDPLSITTIEKLSEVLRRFKDDDPNGNGVKDEKPMYLAGSYELTHLYAAFGMNLLTYNAYAKDGKVYCGAQQEVFKTCLKYINGMYEEGLINRDYLTLTKDKVWAEGRSNDSIGVFLDATADLVAGERAQDFVALPPLTSEAYTGPAFLSGRFAVDPGAFAISSHCKYPEAAMRWIDTLYDVEYSRWDTIGKEGEEWGWDDELHTTWSYKVDTSEIISSRTVQMGGGLPGVEMSYDNFFAKNSEPSIRHSYEQIARVQPYIRPGYPPVSFDETTLRAISSVSSSLSTYLGDLMANVIKGEVDIDAQWDTIQNTLRSMGVKQYIDTLQKGYDNFMAII